MNLEKWVVVHLKIVISYQVFGHVVRFTVSDNVYMIEKKKKKQEGLFLFSFSNVFLFMQVLALSNRCR